MEENLGSGMREIAEERLQPADLAQAHRTICDWHLKHRRPADALQHADCAYDWERISLLMLLHFHELSVAAKRQAYQILSRMPCGMLRTHPWMGWFRILLLNDAPGTTLTTLQAAGRPFWGASTLRRRACTRWWWTV
ncbi:hypothetical protein [Nesterenkonia pannonica]|uniref:hypothetical protein n=1 Tax=Nesterenkonia pannonica TaxID=1548602 RepID=UPI00216428FB|nr:hypothetical protein [Nesterenkonia pannonica]